MDDLTRVLLIDRDARLVRAWKEVFREIDLVDARAGDYFDEPADAMVSPANSFGIMDGGLDFETDDARWPLLISAPTMRVPEDVSRTVHAYWAFRAILLAVRRHNETHTEKPIRSLLCPGLGTGVGAMPARRCAAQMRQAWLQVAGAPRLPTFDKIHLVHQAMKSVD